MPKGPQGQKRLADVVADFQFESVDVQRLAAKLKIRQRALRAASEQQSTAGPTPSDRRSEHDIIQRVRDHYQSQKQKAEPVLQQLEAHRNETQNHLALTVFDDLSRDATNQAETEVHQTTNRIEAACNNVRTATNALAIFREKHHIDYPAQYPESRLLHAALALVLLFGESVWNGWFLRVGQVHGLLGGIGLAMFISAVNVGVSFLVGRIALPATHHRRPWVKAAGWLGFVVYVALIVFMNMVVGHYRALITLLTGREVFSVLEIIQAGFDAFRIALEISNLSNLDLQSALLIVLGWVVALVALLDGFKIDDKYPGYGSLDRRRRRASADYEREKNNLLHRTNEAFDNCRRKLDALKERCTNWLMEWLDSVERSEAVLDRFDSGMTRLERDANYLVQSYRHTVRAVRDAQKQHLSDQPRWPKDAGPGRSRDASPRAEESEDVLGAAWRFEPDESDIQKAFKSVIQDFPSLEKKQQFVTRNQTEIRTAYMKTATTLQDGRQEALRTLAALFRSIEQEPEPARRRDVLRSFAIREHRGT